MEIVKKSNLAAVMREYEKDGEKKKVWRTIGELVTFRDEDGNTFTKCELYHMPGVQISVFEQREKDVE